MEARVERNQSTVYVRRFYLCYSFLSIAVCYYLAYTFSNFYLYVPGICRMTPTSWRLCLCVIFSPWVWWDLWLALTNTIQQWRQAICDCVCFYVVTLHKMCQFDWVTGCPESGLRLFVGVSLTEFLEEISTWTGGLSKEDSPPPHRRAPSKHWGPQ